MNNKLTAKVNARNNVNALAARLAPVVFEALKPFVGQKVKTVGGGKMVKFEKAIEALNLPGYHACIGLQAYVKCGAYTMTLEVRSSGEAGGEHKTDEAVVYLGDISGQTLKSLYTAPNPDSFRTDFHPEEIASAREAVKAAREALRDAETSLRGFGEHDNF